MKHTKSDSDPREDGFYMPAEWAEHSCCWMAWPCREGLWANTEGTQRTYADVANAIARFEPLKMLAPAHKLEAARALLGGGVEIVEMAIALYLIALTAMAASEWKRKSA